MMLLAAFGVLFNLGMMTFFGVCVFLILMIMIQKPQGGGLSAAFGASSGSGQTAFGTKTGDALTVATIILFAIWIVVATVLNLTGNPSLAAAQASPKAVAPAGDTKAATPEKTETAPPAVTPQPTAPPATVPETVPAVNPAPGTQPQGTPSSTPSSTPPATTPPAPATPPAGDPPANPR